MRILIFNPSYPPVACGVGDYTHGLAAALVRAGHDVTVVTAATSTTAADGQPCVLPLLRDWGVGAFLRAWPRFSKPRPDLVVSCFPAVIQGSYARLLYLLPALAKALLGRPRTTFIVHEFVRTGETERRLLRLALWAADRVVAVTEAERDALVGRYPSVAARTVVRHNAPSIPVAVEDPAADAGTRAALAPPERHVIAFFGLIWAAGKGFEELLEALARTDALLVVTGSLDPANAYHAHVAAQIERLGVGHRVRWLGFLDDEQVGRLLRAVDAVVLPYRGGAESGYTSLLAAIVNGAAVITTRGPQNPPWLRDGETALLVGPSDPAALESAIGRLLSDAVLAARVRAGARELPFGWEEIVEAVVAPAAFVSARRREPRAGAR
jgi:glycosyltransferase involved in cell wall biosynthesis